jgi:peptidoglycan/xylan/chitin deacetylase (PgdA/CDA1 family)
MRPLSSASPPVGNRSQRLTVLAYHDVQDPASLERHLAFLRRWMNPVCAGRAIDALDGRVALPPRAVLVTFDDAHWTVYERGLELLRRYEIPAVVFAVAELIGTDLPYWFDEVRRLVSEGATSEAAGGKDPDDAVRLLKRLADADRRKVIEELRDSVGGRRHRSRQLKPEELREMETSGVEIGNHTHSHPCLDRCSTPVVEEEVRRAHEVLGGWLDHPPRLFAYPNGNGDERAEEELERLGYRAAFLFDHRIGKLPPVSRYRISRLRVNSTTAMTRFRNIVCGLHPFIHHELLGRS